VVGGVGGSVCRGRLIYVEAVPEVQRNRQGEVCEGSGLGGDVLRSLVRAQA